MQPRLREFDPRLVLQMVMLHLAPIKPRELPPRDSFLAPNGTYYALRFPTRELAEELVALGVVRVVLPGTHFDARLLPEISDVLTAGGIEVVYQQVA